MPNFDRDFYVEHENTANRERHAPNDYSLVELHRYSVKKFEAVF